MTVRRVSSTAPCAASIGVVEHGNSAVIVTLGADDTLLDRRTVDLTRGLPTHPYHHEGAWAVGRYLDSPWARPVTLDEAIALIGRVHDAAREGARAALGALAATLRGSVACIAIRACPPLPPTIVERITDNRAQVVADSVLYREALAEAAVSLGWPVVWYDRDRVADEAARRLAPASLSALLGAMGKAVGPPWQARHKLAATAAIASRGVVSAGDSRAASAPARRHRSKRDH